MAAARRTPSQERELKELLTRDHTLNGAILFGLDGHVVEMQARAMDVLREKHPLTGVTKISGMAREGVRESLDPIAGAFAKLQLAESEVTVMVNLAPPDLPKDGAWLDLPLAILMLQAAGTLPDLAEYKEGDYILFGEVGLHGEIRRVPGALSLASCAKPGQTLIVPAGNEKECALILAKPGHENCRVAGVSTLDEVIHFFRGKGKLENALREAIHFEDAVPKATDFGLILGQERAKEAAVISAAGGHNLLLIGPPGEGKSLLASAMPGILPRLTNAEKVELTKVYSALGALDRDGMAVTRRPMRHVHHTASKQALVGGGSRIPRPGEITLAHLGVLFLDELAEFSRATIESIRQPIETGEIVISRVGATPERLLIRHPSAQIWCVRIGYPAVHRRCVNAVGRDRRRGPDFKKISLSRAFRLNHPGWSGGDEPVDKIPAATADGSNGSIRFTQRHSLRERNQVS